MTGTVVERLALVMNDVQAVKKGDRNQQQNFNFRGIDSVINAVGPALRAHGVVAVPVNVLSAFEQYETKTKTQMRNCVLTITWRFYGPAGDFIEAQTMGEASDAGDKSVPKAHSVAYRILLLQALCIPTDEPDPDSQAHERARPEMVDQRTMLRSQIAARAKDRGQSPEHVATDFAGWAEGVSIREADETLLTRYLESVMS
jgi:hypothetical protein